MGITNMSIKITAVFMLFMISAFSCGKLQGSYNLDVVADRILANLNEFKQNAIAKFQLKNLTLDEQDSAFERLGARFERVQKDMKNYHYKFEQVVEKMSNQTRVNELMEKNNSMEKLFREINKMGEEKEKEMRSKERETRPHGKRNGSKNKNSTRNSTRRQRRRQNRKRNGSKNKNSTRNSTRRPNGKGPNGKRNGSENKNSTRNSTRRPNGKNGKGPHGKRNGSENKNSTGNSTRRQRRRQN